MKTFNLRALAASLLLSALFASAPAPGQTVRSPPRKDSERLTLKYDGDMAALLHHLAWEYGVTVGLETPAREPRPKVNLFLRDVALRDILAAVAEQHPEYRWQEAGGAFDFYPAAGRSPLLDAQVASFELKDADWHDGLDALFALPEVAAVAVAEGLVHREPFTVTPERRGARFSLALKGVTVRAALHEMARKGGGHFWVYRQAAAGSEKTFSVN